MEQHHLDLAVLATYVEIATGGDDLALRRLDDERALQVGRHAEIGPAILHVHHPRRFAEGHGNAGLGIEEKLAAIVQRHMLLLANLGLIDLGACRTPEQGASGSDRQQTRQQGAASGQRRCQAHARPQIGKVTEPVARRLVRWASAPTR